MATLRDVVTLNKRDITIYFMKTTKKILPISNQIEHDVT
jgi:hypothetical protein